VNGVNDFGPQKYHLLRLPAAGDNAGMSSGLPKSESPKTAAASRPFQFSMRQMFGVVALFTVSARYFSLLGPVVRQQIHHSPDWWFVALWLGAFTAGAAGFGCIAGRTVFGATCGIVLGAVVLVLWNNFPVGA
jgi:hypothetical protein